jgi:hypothetical protein
MTEQAAESRPSPARTDSDRSQGWDNSDFALGGVRVRSALVTRRSCGEVGRA